jgi:hypothetical protein
VSYTAAEAARVAKSQVGKRETGNNDTPYNRWLGKIPGYPHGGYGYPWCQSFQSWVASKAGGSANTDYPKTAGCEVAVAWFRRRGRLTDTPHVGDMVFYGPGGGTHVELIIAVSRSAITTIGGNTSGTLNGRYHEGNGVYQKRVARSSSRIYRYGRPVYTGTGEDDMEPTTKVEITDYWKDRGQFSHDSYSAAFLWQGSISETRAYGKQILAALAAQRVTIDRLVEALALEAPDTQTLKTEIRQAIESATARFDTEEENP